MPELTEPELTEPEPIEPEPIELELTEQPEPIEQPELMEPTDKPLSLDQARALALTKNLSLQSQVEAYLASSDTARAQEWFYEPELQFVGRQQITDRDNNAAQTTSGGSQSSFNQEETLYDARVQNQLPTGGTISLNYRLTDRINDIGNPTGFGSISTGSDEREFESFLGITFAQPLLRKENIENLGEQNAQNPRVRIRLAAKESEIAFQQIRRELSNVIVQVEVAYWNLYAAIEEKQLREESLEVARDIFADNKERVRLGKMAKLDLLLAESEIAYRETKLEESNRKLHSAKNELNTSFSQSLVAGDLSFAPGDTPQIVPITESWEEIAVDSLHHHPEYLIRKKQAELEGLRLAYAKNQELPQLDLNLSYGFNGLGSTANQSWQRVNDYDKVDWFAGLILNIPLMGDQKAKYETSAAKRRKQQALMNLKGVEIQILNLSVTTYRRLKSDFNTYQKSMQLVGLREKLLDVELAKLGEGKSSSREVFEIESELSESRIDALNKMFDYQKTQIELLVFQGKFLEKRGIDITQEQLMN